MKFWYLAIYGQICPNLNKSSTENCNPDLFLLVPLYTYLAAILVVPSSTHESHNAVSTCGTFLLLNVQKYFVTNTKRLSRIANFNFLYLFIFASLLLNKKS